MANSETERRAIEFVMQCELAAGRVPEDVSRKGAQFDISSPPRKIEVKAFGGSARGAPVPLEERQVREAASDPANFFLYVVDNVTNRGRFEDRDKGDPRKSPVPDDRAHHAAPHLLAHSSCRGL